MRAIEEILRSESFDLVAYIAMDMVLVYFALPTFRRNFRAHYKAGVAGILFRDNGLRPPVVDSLKARLRGRMDLWILRRALTGGGIRKAAFLDHWCTDRARERFKTDVCGYGVDPVFFQPSDQKAARASFGLSSGDFVFLLFGMLSDRKGILESLAMLRQAALPQERTVVMVAGPATPEIRDNLEKELAASSQQYRVIRHDRFIQNAELPPYFAASDCVVCVYKDFSGSSSVLLHGAMYGKPALVAPGGAMADAVERHRIGEVVRLDDPTGFAEAARKLAALSADDRKALAYRAVKYGQSMEARRYMSQFL